MADRSAPAGGEDRPAIAQGRRGIASANIDEEGDWQRQRLVTLAAADPAKGPKLPSHETVRQNLRRAIPETDSPQPGSRGPEKRLNTGPSGSAIALPGGSGTARYRTVGGDRLLGSWRFIAGSPHAPRKYAFRADLRQRIVRSANAMGTGTWTSSATFPPFRPHRAIYRIFTQH
jgi:hypothetical protein